FAFDANNDFRADTLAVVVYAAGALRTVLANSHGKILDVSRAHRPDSRTIAVTFPSRVFRQGGYRWTVLTVYKDRAHCRRGCVDTAPNRVPALFDFTPPIANLAVPDPYNLIATSTDFTVQVQVADRGFSGVRRWSLETRRAGSADWSTIAAGSSASVVDVPRLGSEGATYEFRLTAADAQGNVTTTTRLVSVPIDDANPLLAGAYTGVSWDTFATPGQRFFQNTVHRGLGSDVAFTYAFTGPVLGRPRACGKLLRRRARQHRRWYPADGRGRRLPPVRAGRHAVRAPHSLDHTWRQRRRAPDRCDRDTMRRDSSRGGRRRT